MNQGPGSLNRMYRLVWNEACGSFVAVAENVCAHGKRASRRTAATILAGTLLSGAALGAGPQAPPVNALPTSGQLAAGQATIVQNQNTMTITQGSAQAVLNWATFNIGANASVRFQQPDANSMALNRVLSADPSAIFGSLSANGQVMLLNPNGVAFGPNARVDVGGLVAGSLQITDADFLAKRLRFTRGDATGSVVNEGKLHAADGGYLALLAPEVRNEGVMQANLGTVALASGDAVSFDISGNKLLGIKVDPATVKSLVENRQLIQADGGQVLLSAGAAQRLAEQAIATNSVAATTLVEENGVVRLVSAGGTVSAPGGSIKVEGQQVDVSGQLTASGATGGRVDVDAQFLSQSGGLRADGSAGRGGQVTVKADQAVQTASAVLSADGLGGGGTVSVKGGATGSTADDTGRVYSSATLSARGTGSGAKGGHVDVTADSVQLRAATLDASGAAGGGSIRIGGGYQGQDTDLRNAVEVGINASTVIRADAVEHGQGGRVVVWSDGSTLQGGRIAARGGEQGGDGGFAEVSGKRNLGLAGSVDLSAKDGANGRLLLDPKNITIDDAGVTIASLSLDDPTSHRQGGFGTQVKTLANGNVVITAPNANSGSTQKTGAVYLYDANTGALLTQLRGSNANDQVGNGTIEVLANNNLLVRSSEWNRVTGGATYYSGGNGWYSLQSNVDGASGAITWLSGTGSGGSSAIVSDANSLIGSATRNDRVGGASLTKLADGNLVFALPMWNDGRGAVSWMNGSTGELADGSHGGAISSGNSLVGSTGVRSTAIVEAGIFITGATQAQTRTYVYSGGPKAGTEIATVAGGGDEVGRGGVTALADGRYVVASPQWSNGGTAYVGAVTWGDAGGIAGSVSTGNSLRGSVAYDFVGASGVKGVGAADANGLRADYVVASPYWASGGTFLQTQAKGAVTWVDGATGLAKGESAIGATVSASNSIVGNAGDMLGALSSYSTTYYTTSQQSWNGSYYNGYSADATQARGIAGGDGIQVLKNGNYLVKSLSSGSSRGSVTFGDGSIGISGTLSSANSLVGASTGDAIGSGGIFELANGRYAVVSSGWDAGGVADVGAVTWGSASGVTGVVSASNSLVGSATQDRIGSGGLKGVGARDANGLYDNYIVLSPQWDSGGTVSIIGKGAVTFVDGGNGHATNAGPGAVVGSANSLVGSNNGDYVGSVHVSDNRSSSGFGNGTTTLNSDWNAQLQASVDVLANGNYVVRSPNWNSGRGAATWGSGTTGIAGTISSTNSLVGTVADVLAPVSSTHTATNDQYSRTFVDSTLTMTQTGDHVGLTSKTLANGNVLVASAFWSDGRGAITAMDGSTGFVSGASSAGGTISSANSVVGTTPDTYVTNGSGGRLSVATVGDHVGGIGISSRYALPVISAVQGSPNTVVTTQRVVGPYQLGGVGDVSYSSYVGSTWTSVVTGQNTYFQGLPAVGADELPNGNVILRSPGWNNGSAAQAGAITWMNGATGQLNNGAAGGAVGVDNSLVSNVANTRIGSTGIVGPSSNASPTGGVIPLVGGNVALRNDDWGGGKGAVTWMNGTTGLLSNGSHGGAIASGNSLVGSTASGYVATTGWHVEPDGSWVNGPYLASDNRGDRVGNGGVFALSDGAFVVASSGWNKGATGTNALGAATWVAVDGKTIDGADGAAVTAANSLVGTQAGDAVSSGGVARLDNGRYAVVSPTWSNGSTSRVGAVTFGDAGGVAGAVATDNSLTGTTANDSVGNQGVTVLRDQGGTYANYLVRSSAWQPVAGQSNGGAVTWVDGRTGRPYGSSSAGATVSSANSLVSSAGTGGMLGSNLQAFNVDGRPSGDALLVSDSFNLFGEIGAITLIPGETGLAGEIGWRNSIVGFQGRSSSNGGSSYVQFTTIPIAATADEKVNYRPIVWTQNGSPSALVLSVVDEDATYAQGKVGHSPLSVSAGDGPAWRTAGFAGDASGFSLLGGNAGTMSFATMGLQDLVITPGQITSLLNAGTDVTLQATNDITVAKAVLADNPNGRGGDFTLQAGRSIRINADIRTDGGDFTAVANEDGVMPQGCTTCMAELAMKPGAAIDAVEGNVTLTLKKSTDKVRSDTRYTYQYDSSTSSFQYLPSTVTVDLNAAGDITLGSISGNRIQVRNDAGSIKTNAAANVAFTSSAATADAEIAMQALGHVVIGNQTVAQDVAIGLGTGATGAFDLRLHSNLGDTSGGTSRQGAIRLHNATVDTNGGDIAMGGGTLGGSGAAWGSSATVNGFAMNRGIAVTGASSLNAGAGSVTLRGATAQSGAIEAQGHGQASSSVASSGVDIHGASGQRAAVDGTQLRIEGTFSGRLSPSANGAGVAIAEADIGTSHAESVSIKGEQLVDSGIRAQNAAVVLAASTLGNATHTTALTIEASGFDTSTVGSSSSSGTLGSVQIASDVAFEGKAGATLTARGSDTAARAQIGGNAATSSTTASSGDFWLSQAALQALATQSSGFGELRLGRDDQTHATSWHGADFATWLAGSPAAFDVRVAGGSGAVSLEGTTALSPADGTMFSVAGGTITAATGFAITNPVDAASRVHLASAGALSLGDSSVNVGRGTLVLEAGGATNVAPGSGAHIVAGELLLKGASASFDLSASQNQVGTIAADAASVKLVNQGGLTVGSVEGVQGMTTTHGLTLQAQGSSADLTLDASVANAGGDLVLAAGSHFINHNAFDTGLDAGTGRYLVYSANPAESTEGMTVEHKHYNQGYTAGATPSYAASGNWFLYSVAPALTVSAGTMSGVYGSALPTVASGGFTGFIDGDTVSTAGLTGLPTLNIASGPTSGAGHRVVGTYGTTIGSIANLASSLGYGFAMGGANGSYTVTQRDVSLSGSTVYDGTASVGGASFDTFSGKLSGDTLAATGTGTRQRDAGSHVAVGLGTLALSGADAANYRIADAGVSITPRTVTLAADHKAKVYGDADPALSFQVGGLGLGAGDSASAVFSGALATASGAAATAGTHAITQGTVAAVSPNYVVGGFQQGTLTVAKAQLTVTAGGASKTYGDTTPTLSYSVDATQLKYADTASVVGGVVLSTVEGAAATAGTHAINATGGTAANYVVTHGAGTLTVDKAVLQLTADDKAKVYGNADPTLSYTVNAAQLKYGDAASVVNGVQLSTVTGAAATAGTHSINAKGGTAANYALVHQDGTLTVAKAPITLKADDKGKVYGTPSPALSYTLDTSGLRYGDAASVVGGVQLGTAEGMGATVGSHAIVATGATAANYTVTALDGTLTVTPDKLKAENLVTLVAAPAPAVATPTTVFASAPSPAPAAEALPVVVMAPTTVQPGQLSVIGGGLQIGNTSLLSAPAATSAAPVPAVPAASPAPASSGDTGMASTMGTTALVDVPPRVTVGQALSISVPATALRIPDVEGPVTVEAHQSNGQPLPAWLSFDRQTGTFSGTPPQNATGTIETVIVIRTADGVQQTTPLRITVTRDAAQSR